MSVMVEVEGILQVSMDDIDPKDLESIDDYWKLGESFVGGSKNRERSFALQDFDQTGSFSCFEEGLELLCFHF